MLLQRRNIILREKKALYNLSVKTTIGRYFLGRGGLRYLSIAIVHGLYRIVVYTHVCAEIELPKVKVPLICLGTEGCVQWMPNAAHRVCNGYFSPSQPVSQGPVSTFRQQQLGLKVSAFQQMRCFAWAFPCGYKETDKREHGCRAATGTFGQSLNNVV